MGVGKKTGFAKKKRNKKTELSTIEAVALCAVKTIYTHSPTVVTRNAPTSSSSGLTAAANRKALTCFQ